jgi:hypothetical protein
MSKYKHIAIGIGIGALLASFILLLIFNTQEAGSSEFDNDKSVDTVYLSPEPEIQIERVVEKINVPTNDTVMLLTNINQNIDSGDYVVLRDKLLSSRMVNILQKAKQDQTQASDVLIERINSDHFFGDKINVEFWESPIDYQGYRLNKTKLILFGINPNDFFELNNSHEGYLLMNSGGQTAILYPTEKYRTFNFR